MRILARPKPGLALPQVRSSLQVVELSSLGSVRIPTNPSFPKLRRNIWRVPIPTLLRIFLQLLAESLLVSLVGGTSSAVLGWWFTRLRDSIHLPMAVTIRMNLGFDWRDFGYIGLIVIASDLAVGLVPAWRASRMNLNAGLREGGRSSGPGSSHQRMRSALVVAQVAGTLIVLITAGLFIRSLQIPCKTDLVFRSESMQQHSRDHFRGKSSVA